MPVEPSNIVAMLKRIHLFRGVDEAKLDSAVGLMEVEEHPAGSIIYQQGDVSEDFYFIYAGRARMVRYRDDTKQFQQMGLLEEDDYFGHEVLESNWPRQSTVETVTDVTLLRLSVPNFVTLIELIPVLGQRLQLILDSFRLNLKSNFSWIDTDETIYFVARKHVLFLWAHILPATAYALTIPPILLYFYLGNVTSVILLLLFSVSTVIALAWWLWGYIDWSNDYYLVTNRRIIYQERVVLLYDSRQESPNEAVQSTSTNTSQLGRWLGYGNVAIRTYIGTILFRSVTLPEQVMGIVQEQQLRTQISQRRAELKAMETTIERKIGLIPTPSAPTKQPKTNTGPNPLQKLLSDLLHLRYETGGTVLYRTHWFILLKKVLAPLLILLALVGVLIFSAYNQFAALSVGATCGLLFIFGFIVLLWFLYQFFDWHNDVYLITPDQVVDVNKKPLGHEHRQAAPIKNILSIEYERKGIIGLVLNYGTVSIRVGEQTLTFDEVFNPSEVQRELFHRLAAKNYAEKQAQAESERQRMAEWVAAYHRVTQRNQPPRTPPARTGF